jgi:uncharacterized protein YecE (DUF72 family)
VEEAGSFKLRAGGELTTVVCFLMRARVPAGRDLRVGCGGWSDYPGGLIKYAERFDFVEVNVTHYRPVSVSIAERWRRQVSLRPTFEFSVKAPPSFGSRLQRNEFLELVSALDARFVVMRSDADAIEELRDLLLALGATPVVYRARGSTSIPKISGVLYAWDPVLEEPPGPAGYARVFGVAQGILDHLGEGMLKTAAERLGRWTKDLMKVRVVAHTYRSADDAVRIREALLAY